MCKILACYCRKLFVILLDEILYCNCVNYNNGYFYHILSWIIAPFVKILKFIGNFTQAILS